MYGFSVSLISTIDGRRRIDSIQLTEEGFGQRHDVRKALCVVHPENGTLFDGVETGPGLEFPVETFTSLTLDETRNLANGVDVDLSVLLSLQEAKSAIEKNARDAGTPPSIFIELR